jgi:hypothetical protein
LILDGRVQEGRDSLILVAASLKHQSAQSMP